IRILNHQVAIEDGVGKGLPQRLHNQRPNREIRYEMPVHHVAMDHRAAAVERGLRIFAQPREICGENRGCQFNGHELRAAPSLPWRKQIIRGTSAKLVEKCNSNESPRITTESRTVSRCSRAPARAGASRSTRIRKLRLAWRAPEARRARLHNNRGSRRWPKECAAVRTNPLWERLERPNSLPAHIPRVCPRECSPGEDSFLVDQMFASRNCPACRTKRIVGVARPRECWSEEPRACLLNNKA